MRNRIFFIIISFGLVIPFSVNSATIPTFSRTDYTLHAQLTYVLSLDINNDGILDIVSVCRMGLVSTYLGNGDGTFQNEKYFSPYTYMSFFLPGDYNKDGNIDFVTNGKIMLGDEKGGFEIHDIDMGTGDLPYGSSGDINGDGYLDLVVGDHLNVLINNGDGTFHFEKSIFPDKSAQLISLEDFNNDGFPDLVIGTVWEEVRYVDYYPSNGKEVWGKNINIYSDGSYNSFFSPEKADINRDNNTDLLLNIGWHGRTVLFLSDGKGNFIRNCLPTYRRHMKKLDSCKAG